jgi:hypothetical protein
MKGTQAKHFFLKIIAAAVFGAAFWLFQEAVQARAATMLYGCGDGCERCANILYDRAQIICAVSAALAALWWSHLKVSGFKGIIKTLLVCGLSFQTFSIWTAWHLSQRSPCTALYSPGPIGSAGYVVVGLVLLFQSLYWAIMCALALLVFNAIRRALASRAGDVQSLNLQERQ